MAAVCSSSKQPGLRRAGFGAEGLEDSALTLAGQTFNSKPGPIGRSDSTVEVRPLARGKRGGAAQQEPGGRLPDAIKVGVDYYFGGSFLNIIIV